MSKLPYVEPALKGPVLWRNKIILSPCFKVPFCLPDVKTTMKKKLAMGFNQVRLAAFLFCFSLLQQYKHSSNGKEDMHITNSSAVKEMNFSHQFLFKYTGLWNYTGVFIISHEKTWFLVIFSREVRKNDSKVWLFWYGWLVSMEIFAILSISPPPLLFLKSQEDEWDTSKKVKQMLSYFYVHLKCL